MFTFYHLFSQTTLSRLSICFAVSICALRILPHRMRFVMVMTACHRWEFVSTLSFEWEVFTGRRPWKWSFAVYLLARTLTLISITLNLIGLSVTSRYNCNVSG